jgi:hypothetical protein
VRKQPHYRLVRLSFFLANSFIDSGLASQRFSSFA